jgi:electron-transferring-flavoprotein dehydrogenase
VRYGAKTIPYGGWWSIPPLAGDGWMIIGDSAGFLNSQRLKGIHLAIKSGMLAAETAFEAWLAGNSSARQLSRLQAKVDESWIREELYPVRNFHQAFEQGFVTGMMNAALLMVSGGRGVFERYPSHAGHEHMMQLWDVQGYSGDREQLLGAARGDGKLTFDKLTDVYHSGTRHDEDQPAHLIIHDTDICNHRCTWEYGNPCQNFCPAKVYEMVESPEQPGTRRIHLTPSNCVHCKACDVMDPYQIITWVPPEGGGGPNYEGM